MNVDDMNSQVSVFGQNEAMDDFPVLKAFQQYINAEQEKARKRILGLGIFFGAVLVIVIAVFMVLLHGINTRNQTLSDRLVEYAMKESERRQVSAQAQPPAQDTAALKAMTETLAAIQKKLQDPETKPLAYDAEQARRVSEEATKLENAKKLLEQEKQRLAEEKDRLHRIEIDQQRRKLYPEDSSPSRTKSRTLTEDDIRDIIREVYATTPSKTVETPAVAPEEAEEDEAIEYFRDDEYTIPVEVKGSSSKVKFTVPIDD